jgi:hypothetical protein
VEEYLCVTLLSNPNETEADFKARLTALWSRLLREQPDDFARVYAEAVGFENHGDRLGRRYLVEADVVESLCRVIAYAGLAFDPVQTDEVYSKYEAAPPEWFWIEH